jgi:hypothetical protein
VQVVQSMAALTHDATRLLALAMVKYSAVDDTQLSVMRQQARTQLEKEEEQAEADRQLRVWDTITNENLYMYIRTACLTGVYYRQSLHWWAIPYQIVKCYHIPSVVQPSFTDHQLTCKQTKMSYYTCS